MRIDLFAAARQGDEAYEEAVKQLARQQCDDDRGGAPYLKEWKENPRFGSTDPAHRFEAGYRWIATFVYYHEKNPNALATYGVTPDGTARCWAD